LLGWAGLLAGLVGLAAVALYAQGRVARVERDLAKRIQAVEAREQQFEQQTRVMSDSLRDTQGKAAVMEAKLADSLGQQSQLRQLYEQMALSRGDAMLADVENSVMIAAQQLQLGGNVPSALLALQDAEQVLSRSNQPAAIGLRRYIARDIDRLKAMPVTDFAAAVNRLDGVIAGAEQLPLVADAGRQPKVAAESAEPERGGLLGLPGRVARTGLQGWEGFVAEMRQLVRVQRIDRPEALLLSPDQRFFARENLKLLLLNARLNLLARNESLFRADVARARTALERWFDVDSKPVSSTLASLRQLESATLTLQMPSLAETTAAIRAARAVRDVR
jgi:uroporphyrin-3 C-methyltransferase/uroporphyrinogen III methyltransferase/synthase